MKENSIENSTEVFEKVLLEKKEVHYTLRLYIAGTGLQSIVALKNLQKICDEYLPGKHELEVIDIYEQPERLQTENIVAIPTLLKVFPKPYQRIIGNFSDKQKVLTALGLI
ncbi:circadian clock KaiB family protein [Lyngbya sp. PCC 8106]|uniref:circadian clock KaiB family protein n=1 Tax=Lyngbya sp. (strain PCC 8106) TaxID=313612 RepID=UPI0000EA97B3|nr:circadian clock KaiB family protein [Lyngbya sp. PCC 8106]EAW36891.1 thiol-disulfide isomerase [Lyngbya sp. PCC 8106]